MIAKGPVNFAPQYPYPTPKMDSAYDHISEESFSSDRASTPTPQRAETASSKPNLNTEFQETFQAFSKSPWGAKLGGLWGRVRKQGEQYYEDAKREVEGVGEEALKGLSDLKETITKQTRSLSLEGENRERPRMDEGSDTGTSTKTEREDKPSNKKRTESEVIRDNESLISKFRSEAAKRLKDLEKAEDAADEALLRFGTNIRNFLRDAVAVAPPNDDSGQMESNANVLFESKDSAGKRVIHTTRFEAQLHVIHSTFDSFMKDPISGEWPKFRDSFKIDEKTEDISQDLERYTDLRKAMEQLVPEKVEYKEFWRRYYFLRLVIETEEQRRKDLLKGTIRIPSFCIMHALTSIFSGASTQNGQDEEIAWDADSDEEQETSPRPSTSHRITLTSHEDTASTTTISQQPQSAATATLSKPAEGRQSNDQHSQPDSDASYDLVSGATSKTPGSPKEEKEKEKTMKKNEDSDEEDWE